MPATQDSRRLVAGPDGTFFMITKGPNETFQLVVDFTDWLGGATAVASCAAPVLAPVDGTNAPTLVVSHVASPLVTLTLNAGTNLWNTHGLGTASALVTMVNGEKKELNFLIDILQQPGYAPIPPELPLVTDTFTRANDATHPGTADTGQAWIVVGGSIGINSNRLTFVDGTAATVALVNAGQNDVFFEIDVEHIYSDVILRSNVGATSYFESQPQGTVYNILATGGGGATLAVTGPALVAGDRLGYVLYGESIVHLLNGVPILAYTEGTTPRLTQNYFGVRGFAGGFNSAWDNLSIRKIDTFPQIIFDGDSLTLGSGLSNPNLSYPDQVMLALTPLSGNPWAFRNFGVFGEAATLMVTNAPSVIDPLYNTSQAKNIVSVWAGTNDLNENPGGAAGVYDTLKTYWAARRAVGWKVIAFTFTPRSDGGASISHESDRIALNNLIRSDATLYDALVDLGGNGTIGAPGASTNTTYFQDGLHLTAVGYTIVAGLVETAIAGL